MDKMVVEADCIPGGIDGEAKTSGVVRTRVRHRTGSRSWTAGRFRLAVRKACGACGQGVLDFGQKIKSEGNEAEAQKLRAKRSSWQAFLNENWEGALTR